LKLFLRPLARLSLGANHAVGALLGRMVYALSPRFRLRTLENIATSGLVGSAEDVRRLARINAAEIGKGATELIWALLRPIEEVIAQVRSLEGWEAVETLRAGDRPIIFVTPHLGGYDIAGRYLWARLPLMAMYRPHKLAWLDRMLRAGRDRGSKPGGTNTATATIAGVRKVLKHMRGGGCTIMLPDQVPGVGEGEWVEFFGRPAYTMTLVGRLQQASDAAIVFCYAERLAGGAGFNMHFAALDAPLCLDRGASARQVNEMVERLVRRCPAQYLWGYNRYKRPAGAPPAPARR
jgi:KDO2-lipid IV(A) lauroyltransferase